MKHRRLSDYGLAIVVFVLITTSCYSRTIDSGMEDCTAPCCKLTETPTGNYIEYRCLVEEVQCAIAMGMNCQYRTDESVVYCSCSIQLVYGMPEFICVYPRDGTADCKEGQNTNELCTAFDRMIIQLKAEAEANLWECVSHINPAPECIITWNPTRAR